VNLKENKRPEMNEIIREVARVSTSYYAQSEREREKEKKRKKERRHFECGVGYASFVCKSVRRRDRTRFK
jgi:hypothetical protein